MPVPPSPADRLPPPRPAPERSPAERIAAWLGWFGWSRLVLAGLSLVAVGAGAYWLLRAPQPDVAVTLPMTSATASSVPAGTLPPPNISVVDTVPSPLYVHVAGAVVAPGVYPLPSGSRTDAAVAAAGGVRPDGDLDALNLAAPLADGQRVYVPMLGEIDPATVADGAAPLDPAGSGPVGPLDLNTAGVTDLERLPGIGPATAAAIVDDRTRNGPFATVDDLERVPGIGPAKLAALREMVTA